MAVSRAIRESRPANRQSFGLRHESRKPITSCVLKVLLTLVALGSLALADSTIAIPLRAQTGATLPERAVRRDIPLTNIIRKAFAAGTRDSTGRPGKNYAQLRTDYTINATLDPSTSRITGRESIVISNNTADSLASIVMRLDQNLFLFQSPHLAPWIPSENTDGFVITKFTVNGQPDVVYVIQASTNLTSWDSLTTTSSATGTITYTDTTTPTPQQRYYRTLNQ